MKNLLFVILLSGTFFFYACGSASQEQVAEEPTTDEMTADEVAAEGDVIEFEEVEAEDVAKEKEEGDYGDESEEVEG